MTEARVIPAAYLVTIWPDELMDNPDADSYFLYVVHRRREPRAWGISRSFAGAGPWLSCGGAWSHEIQDTDAWRYEHRFELDVALELARFYAPRVRAYGVTAEECVAWHRAGCPDRDKKEVT